MPWPREPRALLDRDADPGPSRVGLRRPVTPPSCKLAVDLKSQLLRLERSGEEVPGGQPAIGSDFVVAADVSQAGVGAQPIVRKGVARFRGRLTGCPSEPGQGCSSGRSK